MTSFEAQAATLSDPYMDFLKANAAAYDWLMERALSAFDAGGIEDAVELGGRAASFAAVHHPGRFSDGALENMLQAIGRMLPADAGVSTSVRGRDGPRTPLRVLHLLSTVALGGHVPLVSRWICADTESSHSILLLNGNRHGTQPDLDSLANLGCEVSYLNNGTPLKRSVELRERTALEADLVVWHNISPEVVPVLAFAKPEGPPIVVVDHADHMFWTGGSIADLLVCLRPIGRELTASRRSSAPCHVLPIPLETPPTATLREAWRRRMGFDQNAVILLSVGRGLKYRACGQFDFLATVGKALDRQQNVQMVIVGATQRDVDGHTGLPHHERLRFMGPTRGVELDAARAGSDIYLESFPYGSQTALLEAALSGLPVVRALNPVSPLLVTSDASIDGIVKVAGDERAYLELIERLASSAEERQAVGTALKVRVQAAHCGSPWLSQLRSIYSACAGLEHRPQNHARAASRFDAIDVGLSLWSVAANGRDTRPVPDRNLSVAALMHRGYVERYVRNFHAARRTAIKAALASPFSAESHRALGLSLLGPVWPALRRRIKSICGKRMPD